MQCMYLLLHTVKGTPFETPDQGKARLLTHWEQMDYGVQFTASRKFLTITPIILCAQTCHWDSHTPHRDTLTHTHTHTCEHTLVPPPPALPLRHTHIQTLLQRI